MSRILLSIGSSINPERHIPQAIKQLQLYFQEIQLSRLYESESVGFKGNNFINAAIAAQTDLTLEQVVSSIKKIEDSIGRDRSQGKYADKNIDLDLLSYDQEICQIPVILPRPEITENAYVLWPLAEIAGQEIHPTTGLTYQQLWQQYDKQKQKLWPIDKQHPLAQLKTTTN